MPTQKRILFVDDEAFFGRSYISCLQKSGFVVELCDDAGDALERLTSGPSVDAIVLDVMMPSPAGLSPDDCDAGLSTGIYLLKRLLEVRALARGTPVVFLTNHRPEVVSQHCRELQIPESWFTICSKAETPAFYLPHLLEAAIERGSEGNKGQ